MFIESVKVKTTTIPPRKRKDAKVDAEQKR